MTTECRVKKWSVLASSWPHPPLPILRQSYLITRQQNNPFRQWLHSSDGTDYDIPRTNTKLGERAAFCVSSTGTLQIIGATLYVTMVTCHHHFWKWWWLSPPLFQSGICNFSSNSKFYNIAIPIFSYTFGKRLVFFLLPEVFCGLKYAENAIAAGALPWTLLGELMTLP